MKRRTFIASLVALPAGCVAAATAPASPVGLDLDEIFAELNQIKSNRLVLFVDPGHWDGFSYHWFDPSERISPNAGGISPLP